MDSNFFKSSSYIERGFSPVCKFYVFFHSLASTQRNLFLVIENSKNLSAPIAVFPRSLMIAIKYLPSISDQNFTNVDSLDELDLTFVFTYYYMSQCSSYDRSCINVKTFPFIYLLFGQQPQKTDSQLRLSNFSLLIKNSNCDNIFNNCKINVKLEYTIKRLTIRMSTYYFQGCDIFFI